ncbi:MAG TPA: hypothetical protein VK107_04065 [Alloiococcus sp.]|nr:hypothetical protein [Alloiococcus sp.]
MKKFNVIFGWLAILIGIAGLGLQVTELGYAAIVLGVIALFIKDIRGMGITTIGFGIVTYLMTTLYT